MHRIAFEIKLPIHYAASSQPINQSSDSSFYARLISSFFIITSITFALFYSLVPSIKRIFVWVFFNFISF